MDAYSWNSNRPGQVRLSKALTLIIAGIVMVITPQLCYGQDDGEALLFVAEDIAGWKSSIAAGGAELTDDGFALITGGGGWGGGVASPWITVDLAKSPVLVIKVHEISNNWTMKAGLYNQENEWGPYIQGDTAAIDEFSYKLPDALNNYPAGVQPPDPEDAVDIQLRVWGTGLGNAQVSVESIRIFYEGDPNDRPRFVDPDLEKEYAGRNTPVEPREKLSICWGSIK